MAKAIDLFSCCFMVSTAAGDTQTFLPRRTSNTLMTTYNLSIVFILLYHAFCHWRKLSKLGIHIVGSLSLQLIRYWAARDCNSIKCDSMPKHRVVLCLCLQNSFIGSIINGTTRHLHELMLQSRFHMVCDKVPVNLSTFYWWGSVFLFYS